MFKELVVLRLADHWCGGRLPTYDCGMVAVCWTKSDRSNSRQQHEDDDGEDDAADDEDDDENDDDGDSNDDD